MFFAYGGSSTYISICWIYIRFLHIFTFWVNVFTFWVNVAAPKCKTTQNVKTLNYGIFLFKYISICVTIVAYGGSSTYMAICGIFIRFLYVFTFWVNVFTFWVNLAAPKCKNNPKCKNAEISYISLKIYLNMCYDCFFRSKFYLYRHFLGFS